MRFRRGQKSTSPEHWEVSSTALAILRELNLCSLGTNTCTLAVDMGVSEHEGYLNLGPYNEDPTIQGTILGSSISETPIFRSYVWPRLSVEV